MASTPEQVVCTPTFVFPTSFPVNGFQLWKEEQKDVLTLCNSAGTWTDYRGFDPRLANFHVAAAVSSQLQQQLPPQPHQPQQQQQQQQQQNPAAEDSKSSAKANQRGNGSKSQIDFSAARNLLISAPPAFPGIEAQVPVLKIQTENKQQPQQQQPTQRVEDMKEGGRSWPCPSCKVPFKQASDLQAHLSSHTKTEGGPGPERTVPCDICGKCFASGERARVHARSAHGDKPCACEVCGSGFSYRCKLLDHMRTHTGDKPFPCDICGKSFSQKNHLTRHAMIHSGERPFPCEFCGRGFYRKDKLTRHRRIHTGERVTGQQPRRPRGGATGQFTSAKMGGHRGTIKMETGMIESGAPPSVAPSPSHYRPTDWQQQQQQQQQQH